MGAVIGFDAGLALQAALATEKAAISAAHLAGRGDEKAADQAAVDALRTGLNAMNIRGRIVIGEGERDEAWQMRLRLWRLRQRAVFYMHQTFIWTKSQLGQVTKKA